MALIKIGKFVERYSKKCGISDLTVDDISGINREKEFFEPSKQAGADTSGYKIVPPDYFACNLMHVGRDVVLPVSLNHTSKNKIVSPAYTVFRIIDESIILKEYFFMFLKSDEKDRFFWFNTDSSVRDGMDWEDFCNVEFEVPSIEIQKKYVAVYQELQHNVEKLKSGIAECKRVCEIFIDKYCHEGEKTRIGDYIEQTDERNTDLKYAEEDVRGMTITKEIIPTKANITGTELSGFKVVYPGEFVYNPRTHGSKIGLGFNQEQSPFIISWNNESFKVKDTNKIIPEYLYLLFCRSEWDREACFRSWGSSTEVFPWEELCDMKIVVPNIEKQKDIVEIYNAYIERQKTLEKMEGILRRIAPILIKGATEEGGQ